MRTNDSGVSPIEATYPLVLQQAKQHYAAGQLERARQLFAELHSQQPRATEPLEFLAMLALQSQQPEAAIACFRQLTEIAPDNPLYVDRYASLLARTGRADEAQAAYRQLLEHNPHLTVSRFNYAGLLRGCNANEEALAAYQGCLDQGIEQQEEVLANMGAILADLNRDEESAEAFHRALAQAPQYAPAHYNLALHHEERGNWSEAKHHLQLITETDPLYPRALARLAQGEDINDTRHPVVHQLQALLKRDALQAEEREELHFALAKALDDAGQHTQAFIECKAGNALAAARAPAYRRAFEEEQVGRIIAGDETGAWATVEPVSDESLVFICGLFRSGSTLLEQMLAAHPSLTAGGEIDFFSHQLPIEQLLAPISAAMARQLGHDYLAYLSRHYGPEARVINKRLDTSYYLGLLRRLFPRACFLRTLRHPLDNAVSIYFQQLSSAFPYANTLTDIGHYWRQQQRLMDYWEARYPNAVVPVHYERLVSAPEQVLKPVLSQLGVAWDDTCLQFHQQRSRVRTASVAQVRKPLYTGSAGRWQHYASELQPLREMLEKYAVKVL